MKIRHLGHRARFAFLGAALVVLATAGATFAQIPEHQGITEYLGPQTCVACHQAEAEQMHGSVHYQQAGATPNTLNIPGLAGERGPGDIGMNTYCGAHVTSRRSTCGGCHVGNGQYPTPEMTQAQLENIDCMMCHQDAYKRRAAPPFEDLPAIGPEGEPTTVLAPIEDENGFFYEPDEIAMGITILEAARTVHTTTRASCLRCHAKAGGADGAKRGDMSSALLDPPPTIDYHMSAAGPNLSCADCHSVGGHRVRGRGLDLRPNDDAQRLTCGTCHGERPHADYAANDGVSLDVHAARVACQSCHIPTYAKGVSTETDRDWLNPFYSPSVFNGQGGWKPEEVHASDLTPSYAWFDGRSEVYVLNEVPEVNASGEYAFAVPVGGVYSPASKLYPMKEHWSNSARLNTTGEIIPHSTNTFFRTGDFDQAVVDGMAQAGMSGTYTVVPVHTFQTINHGVVTRGSGLECGDCHHGSDLPGGPPRIHLRNDFGYDLKGTHGEVCSQCHGSEPSPGFLQTHSIHVKSRFYDCSACHTFGRPQRGLDVPFPLDDRVTIVMERREDGGLVSWSGESRALAFDLVRGVGTDLKASGGDFGVATESCLANDSGYLSYVDWELPVPDDAWWYLIRPLLAVGPGSYDSGGAAQVAPRDAGINGSLASCP